MSRNDSDVYFEANIQEMKTKTLNSVPMIEIKQFNGDEKVVKFITVKDLDDMELNTIKRIHRINRHDILREHH